MKTQLIIEDLDNTIIGDTGISVRQLLQAFHDVLDGEEDHDIRANTGLPEEDCKQIIEIRNKTRKFWLV